MFDSPADFKNGNFAAKSDLISGFHFGCEEQYHKKEDGGTDYRYYTTEGGRVHCHTFSGTIFLKYDEEGENVFSSPDLPREYYSNAKVALGMLQYAVEDKEGNETTYKGALRRVMLTDEQKKLVEDFKNAYDKLKEAKVKLFYDQSYDRMFAVNSSECVVTSEYCYEVDKDDDFEGERAVVEDMEDEFRLGISFGFLNEEYGLYVNK